jgi:hypothetical protein
MAPTREIIRLAGHALCLALLTLASLAQSQDSYQRSFPQSKTAIEKALAAIQGSMSGRLPVLDGFAKNGEHALDRYSRGYYQATAEVVRTGNSNVVRITTKVTAWFDDPSGTRSGYQLLTSNGRLEADLLDQLQEELARSSPSASLPAPISTPATLPSPHRPPATTATPSAPAAASKFPPNDRGFSTNSKDSLPARQPEAGTPEADKATSALDSELENLQQIAKNVAHPKNLVAVKKSGTPVVPKPSLTAKPEFLASQHDEFELLDFNADWVHVKISGLSRGWIWRNSVEMPEGIPDTDTASPGLPPAADVFQVVREETAPFPGDWEPLRNKNVKIVSVQNVDAGGKNGGPRERLEFARFLFEKNFPELAKNPTDLPGIVLIFDSADGGMIAATTETLKQWRAGTLSDGALWHKCFFDPPETFDSAASSGSK